MIGIRQLAEGRSRNRMMNDVHVALWTVTFGLLVAAVVMVLRRVEDWRRPLAGFVIAAVVFQILTLGQPPIAIGIVLVAVVGAVLLLPVRARPPRQESG
jgi:chromate transport protein ChrA